MACFRPLLPAAHSGSGVPVAALKAAARSGASFWVVCPAGGRAEAVAAALQAATTGAGLVLSSRVVARAAKRSGGRTGEDAEEVFFVGLGGDHTGEEIVNNGTKATGGDHTGEEIVNNGTKATGGDHAGEEIVNNGTKATGGDHAGEEIVNNVTKATGGDHAGEEIVNNGTKDTNDVVFFGADEMTLDELVRMLHKDTLMSLRQVKHFPVGNDETSLASLIASCNAIGEEIHKAQLLDDSPEGRPIVHRLIALHLRIVSCAGGLEILKRGSSLPDFWSGHRHRLPCKEKRAGTLMELLLYSMMLANAALDCAVVWDFTKYD